MRGTVGWTIASILSTRPRSIVWSVTIKRDFKWGENLIPHYDWFDGQMLYTTIDTRLDPAQQPIAINAYQGSPEDPSSRIWPFKRMHTVQPYDKVDNTLVCMYLWGDDESAYWAMA